MYDGQIPYNKRGDQLNYPEAWEYNGETSTTRAAVTWKDNKVFTSTLQVVDYSKGRSSIVIHMRLDDHTHCTMFMHEFMRLVMEGRFDGSFVTGTWTFAKKGQNFGIVEVQQ